MMISDADLEFWGDAFCELGLARYMTFGRFLHNPKAHLTRIFGGEFRPLLRRQQAVQTAVAAVSQRLDADYRYDLMQQLDVLEDLAIKGAQVNQRRALL